MSFSQFINLFLQVAVLLLDFLQLGLGLGGRVAGFEAQPADNGLFGTFGCHTGVVWRDKGFYSVIFALMKTVSSLNCKYSSKGIINNNS